VNQVAVRLGRDHLLWRTHGEHWGFQLLARPELEEQIDWSEIVKELFGSLDPLARAMKTGTLLLSSGATLRYVAQAFCDERQSDAQGRPIQHFMALLVEGDLPTLREDWAACILEHHGRSLERVHALPRDLCELWDSQREGMTWRDYLLSQMDPEEMGRFPELEGTWQPSVEAPAPLPSAQEQLQSDEPPSDSASPAERKGFKHHLGNASLLAVTAGYLTTAFVLPALGIGSPHGTGLSLHGASVAFFEAGMVGGLADWFAVTAIFRHPLGQHWIPHTNLIAKNRDAVQAQLVGLIKQFLTPEIVSAHLDKQLKDMKLGEVVLSPALVDPIMRALESMLQNPKFTLLRPIATSMLESLRPEIVRLLSEPAIDGVVKDGVRKGVHWALSAGIVDQLTIMIDEFLSTMETREIVALIEDRTWGDLQFVRLNGAVVGGIFGLVIYVLASAFGGGMGVV
jgi:hypothetical protein